MDVSPFAWCLARAVLNYPEYISQRETRQDHSFKYVVLGIDEEFERRFPSRYAWSTAIPGPSKGFIKAYEDALGSKQGYLIVDTRPHGTTNTV